MVIDSLIESIFDKLSLDKENNSAELNFLTDRNYPIILAKDLWNDNLIKGNIYWYPEESSYIKDNILKTERFKKLKEIVYSNIDRNDKTILKEKEWEKVFQIYFKKEESKLLIFIKYRKYLSSYSEIFKNFIIVCDTKDFQF